MIDVNKETIQKALDNCSEEALDFVLFTNEQGEPARLVESASEFGLTTSEVTIVNENIKYLALGILSLNEMMDLTLSACNSGDEKILTYIQCVFFGMDDVLKAQIKSRPENKNMDTDYADIFKPADISNASDSTETNTENKSPTTNTKDEILDEIENPTSSVKTQEYTLPRFKPNTADILSGIKATNNNGAAENKPGQQTTTSTPSNEPAIIDPFKIQKTTPGAQTSKQIPVANNKTEQATLIDPIKTIQSTIQPQKPKTASSEIKNNLESKLTNVSVSGNKEQFKSADPYREIPGI